LVVNTCEGCPFLPKILIAGKYAGVQIKVEVSQRGKQGYELGHPLRKVPVLTVDEGVVFESNAIVRYIARENAGSKLFGTNSFEASEIDAWIDISVNDIDGPLGVWEGIIKGTIPNDEVALKKAIADSRKVLQALDTHLLTRTFLVRDRLTLADIVVANSLLPGYRVLFDPGFRKAFRNTNRWFLTLINQLNFISVLGEVSLADKKPVSAEQKVKAEQPKKEKAEHSKKEEPKPKEQSKEEEEEEERYDDPPKKKPFSDYPPSPFNIIEFKYKYSNESCREVALPYFYQNYDRAGWNLWFAEYKYSEELKKPLFMVNNLLGGFYQRAEHIRDFTVGSFHIFGEDNKFTIIGAFLLRGAEWPAEVMNEIPDVESYSFRKIDLENQEDKELFQDLWAWDGKHFTEGWKGSPYSGEGKVLK